MIYEYTTPPLQNTPTPTPPHANIFHSPIYEPPTANTSASFVLPLQSLKGVGGNVVVLEEAAYCDQQVINEVVLPLLSVKDSVLLCISTLLGASNMYSKMFNLIKPNGDPLFETVQINLVCEECAKTDHPEKCTHKTNELPRWLSSDNVEMIKLMLQDDPELLLRETMGINAESTTRAFKECDVEMFVSRSRLTPPRMQHIFTAVDPAGGGASAFAICTIGLTSHGEVLVSIALVVLYGTHSCCNDSPVHISCNTTHIRTNS